MTSTSPGQLTQEEYEAKRADILNSI